jgi:hypothetical protein
VQLSAREAVDEPSAYYWPYGLPLSIGSLGLSFGNLFQVSWEVFVQGADLSLYSRYPFLHGMTLEDQKLPRFEGVLWAAFEPYLPLRFRLYGVWDQRGMNITGRSRTFRSTPFDTFSSAEYVNTDETARMEDLQWLGGGEAEVKLFSFELQRHLSHLYFNRIFSTLAYRGVVDDDGGHPAAEGTLLTGPYRLAQSLVFRLGSQISTAIIPFFPIRASLSFVAAWKMSNMNDGENNDFWPGMEFSLSF